MAAKKYDLDELQALRRTWLVIPPDVIPESNRTTYENRKKAVDMYIDGVGINEIYKATGIHFSNIARLVEKCVQLDETGNFYGYNALIRYNRTKETEKNGKFNNLLIKYPELEDYIKGCWYGNKKYTLEKNMNINSLHKRFLQKCLQIGIPDYEYPFNTANKGYVSLSKYLKSLDKHNIEKAASRDSKDNRQKLLSTGIGERYTQNPLQPFSTVQIDGHIIDLIYNVEIVNEDGTIDRKTATRAWIIAVIDVATRVVLGYSVSQEFNYNQYDVIEAIQDAILPKELINPSIEGLQYPQNGGFYSTAFPELQYAIPDEIMMDNAKPHLAINTMEKIVDHLYCAVNFGSVATPETRGIVERFFQTLETRGFHKLPATTGSNTKDLKRRDPEKAAIQYDITIDDIAEIMGVLIAEYNNTKHSSLNNQSPLECMKRRVFESGLRPTIADEEMINTVERLNYLTEKRVVCGGKNGKRAYINYAGAEYRGYELSATGTFYGKKIVLLVDPRDISEVEAYTEDGLYIGILKARGEFGTKSHSLKTRKNARKLARERGRDKLEFDTPITAYEQALNERGKTSRRDATKADIVRREIGRSKPSELEQERVEEEEWEDNSSKISDLAEVVKQKGIKDTEAFYQLVWGNKKG